MGGSGDFAGSPKGYDQAGISVDCSITNCLGYKRDNQYVIVKATYQVDRHLYARSMI